MNAHHCHILFIQTTFLLARGTKNENPVPPRQMIMNVNFGVQVIQVLQWSLVLMQKNFWVRNKIWQKPKSIIQYIYKVERNLSSWYGVVAEWQTHLTQNQTRNRVGSSPTFPTIRRTLQMIYKIKLSLVRFQHCKPSNFAISSIGRALDLKRRLVFCIYCPLA